MNPQVLFELMKAWGYEPTQEGALDFITGAGNALTLNQLPTIAAAGSAALGGDYEQALERAYAGRQAIKERSPTAFTSGEITGSLVSPINKLGAGSALGRIASGAGQASVYQLGEPGASIEDIQAAGEMGGLLTTGLEAVPMIGKGLRKLQGTLQQSGLGLRGAAMKKAGSKIKDKTILGEGYDLIRSLIKAKDGNAEAIKQANRVLTTSGNRAGSYVEIADDKIRQLVDKQEQIAKGVTQKAFRPVTLKRSDFEGLSNPEEITALFGNKKTIRQLIPRQNLPEIEFDLAKNRSFQEKIKAGNLISQAGKDIGSFEENYIDLAKDILNPLAQAKAKNTRSSLNIEDLMALRRRLSTRYDQYAKQGKAEVYTALVDDLNRAITSNLRKYEGAKIVKPGTADDFAKAGKDMQRLISFNDAVAYSAMGKGALAMPGDMAKAITSGGGLSMAAYFAGVSHPLVATAIGSLGGTPSVQGALGRGLEKGLNAAEAVGAVAGPLARADIKTQTAEEIPLQPTAQPEAPANIAEFESFLDELGLPQPQAAGSVEQRIGDFNRFLDELGLPPSPMPKAAVPEATPAVGSLPNQQQAAATGAAPLGDRFGGLANYFAPLAQTESSMNPLAANKASSAKGLFQFVDKTAAGVGLQDPYDPNQSLDAVQRLTEQHRQQFGDNPDLLYAAHYLGAPTLSAWQQGQQLNPKQQGWVQSFANEALPRFRQQYAEAQQPDNQIMQQFMSLFPQG